MNQSPVKVQSTARPYFVPRRHTAQTIIILAFAFLTILLSVGISVLMQAI